MFDEKKFNNIAKITSDLINKNGKEGQEIIHENLLYLADMLLEELEKDSQKRRKRLEEYFNG